MNEFGMPQFMGFMRGHPAMLMPDRGASSGGGGKPRGGKPARGLSRDKGGGKAAKGGRAPRETPSRTPPDDEDELDLMAEDEEEELDEEELDEEAEDEAEDEEEQDKSKSRDDDKKKKPKMVRVPVDQWRKLQDQRKAAEDADRKAARARARAAQEREEKIAEKDSRRALELTRKRLQRDIDRRDEELDDLRGRNERIAGRLGSLALDSGLRDAIDAVMEERGQELKKGSLPHIKKSIAGQFEIVDSDDDDEVVIVHKETGESLADFLATAFDSDEYNLFIKESGGDKGKGERPAGAKGTHRAPAEARARKERPDKRPSYSEAYHLRVKELQDQEGVKPAIGLRRTTKV